MIEEPQLKVQTDCGNCDTGVILHLRVNTWGKTGHQMLVQPIIIVTRDITGEEPQIYRFNCDAGVIRVSTWCYTTIGVTKCMVLL